MVVATCVNIFIIDRLAADFNEQHSDCAFYLHPILNLP